MNAVLLVFPGNEAMADALAPRLRAEIGKLTLRQFPDGETFVRIDSELSGRTVLLVCSLDRPDTKLLPLVFTADTARDLGAAAVGLICPYLAYLRQDKRFHAGEALTLVSFARVLSSCIDWLATVDPHLHRLPELGAVYSVPAIAVSAAPVIADWIRAKLKRPLLIGPDSESEQWVDAVAALAGAPCVILEKIRHGDHEVVVSVPDVEQWRGHTPVLVDDIISTAGTMVATIGHLRGAGLAAPVCIGVHAVMAGDAEKALLRAGAQQVVTCNSIAHSTNYIDASGPLADAASAWLDEVRDVDTLDR